MVGRPFAVILVPVCFTTKTIFGHSSRVGGLNWKRHFDILRDKLGMDVAPKLKMNFCFWLQLRQAFQVFKWTAGCIFKCETTKTKLAKNIKKDF